MFEASQDVAALAATGASVQESPSQGTGVYKKDFMSRCDIIDWMHERTNPQAHERYEKPGFHASAIKIIDFWFPAQVQQNLCSPFCFYVSEFGAWRGRACAIPTQLPKAKRWAALRDLPSVIMLRRCGGLTSFGRTKAALMISTVLFVLQIY